MKRSAVVFLAGCAAILFFSTRNQLGNPPEVQAIHNELQNNIKRFEASKKQFDEVNAKSDAGTRELGPLPVMIDLSGLGKAVDNYTAEQVPIATEKEKLYRTLIAKEPTNPEHHLLLSRLYAQQSQYEEAKGEAQEAKKVAQEKGDEASAVGAQKILAILADVDKEEVALFKRVKADEISHPDIEKIQFHKLADSIISPEQRAAADAESARQEAALRRKYLNGQTAWSSPPWNSDVSQRLDLASTYLEHHFTEQADQAYADILHEHGDSPFVHLGYAQYLATTKGGADRAIAFLTQPQFQNSQNIVMRVASDTAQELKSRGLENGEYTRLWLEIRYRLDLIGYDMYDAKWRTGLADN